MLSKMCDKRATEKCFFVQGHGTGWWIKVEVKPFSSDSLSI